MRRGSVTRRAGLMSSPFVYTLHTVSVATVMVASRPHRRTLLPASHANKVESTDRCRASTGNVPGYDPSQKCPFPRGGGGSGLHRRFLGPRPRRGHKLVTIPGRCEVPDRFSRFRRARGRDQQTRRRTHRILLCHAAS